MSKIPNVGAVYEHVPLDHPASYLVPVLHELCKLSNYTVYDRGCIMQCSV